jgi:hypothetical protein
MTDLDGHLEEIAILQRTCSLYWNAVGSNGGAAATPDCDTVDDAESAAPVDTLGERLRSALARRFRLCEEYTADKQRYDREHREWLTARRHYYEAPENERRSLVLGPEPRPPASPFPGV